MSRQRVRRSSLTIHPQHLCEHRQHALGAVGGPFAHRGRIGPEQQRRLAAIATARRDLDGATRFFTETTDLDTVSKALTDRKWNVTSANLIWKAKNPVTIDDAAKRAEVEAFLEGLDEDDDVQNIYVGLEP
jgi:hypothetical protein